MRGELTRLQAVEAQEKDQDAALDDLLRHKQDLLQERDRQVRAQSLFGAFASWCMFWRGQETALGHRQEVLQECTCCSEEGLLTEVGCCMCQKLSMGVQEGQILAQRQEATQLRERLRVTEEQRDSLETALDALRVETAAKRAELEKCAPASVNVGGHRGVLLTVRFGSLHAVRANSNFRNLKT